MKVNELRIGNWIKGPKGARYDGREFQWHIGEYIMCNEYSDFIDDIEPILLTEEWLLKMGFKPQGEGYSYTNLLLQDFRESYSMFEWDSYNEVEVCIKNDIKYIHQLQNLYFALTEEELEIKYNK